MIRKRRARLGTNECRKQPQLEMALFGDGCYRTGVACEKCKELLRGFPVFSPRITDGIDGKWHTIIESMWTVARGEEAAPAAQARAPRRVRPAPRAPPSALEEARRVVADEAARHRVPVPDDADDRCLLRVSHELVRRLHPDKASAADDTAGRLQAVCRARRALARSRYTLYHLKTAHL